MPQYTTWNIKDEVDIRMGDGVAGLPPRTLISCIRKTVAELGSANALHVKRNGVWQSITFQEYYDQCRAFGKSLISQDFSRFDTVSIIGFNSPEWFVADIGTILAGGVTAGIYTTNGPKACEYIAQHSKSKFVVCEGITHLEKFIAIEDNLPDLKAIIVWGADIPDTIQAKHPIYTFDDFMKLGADVNDELLDERMDDQRPGHTCLLIYTSGTTGNPKAVMLSHDNVTWTLTTTVERLQANMNLRITNADRMISYLPLSHVAGQFIDVMVNWMFGDQVYFAQPDALKGSLGITLKEVRPTLFFGVPRVYEKIAEKMWAIEKETTGLKKAIATWCKSIGAAKTEMAQYGNSGGVPCGNSVANFLVFSKVRKALGLDCAKGFVSAAAPMNPDILRYFGSLDIPIFEFYGASETSGPHTFTEKGTWKIGTCGRVIDGAEIIINSETEEMLLGGRNIMMGYLNSEEQTKETLEDNGLLHSGDCGVIDEDGFLRVTGRIKELIITAGGENVPPVLLENAILNECQALSNVLVVGDRQKYLAALYTFRVNFNSDGFPTQDLDSKAIHIAEEIGSSARTVAEARECPKFKEYLDNGLKAANSHATSRAQYVQKYTILDKDFSLAGGELTPSMKVKRKNILKQYEDVIINMYK